MKTYKASDLTNNKRAEVFEEAAKNGVIIEMRKTNGDVISELVLIPADAYKEMTEGIEALKNLLIEIKGDL